jgi:hypothetical protein
VRKAIYAIPVYFKTETIIAGIMAGDLFTLGEVLGAAVEEQVVRTLNEIRLVWDPDSKYQLYSFLRQPQTFPDVLLRSSDDHNDIVMGIELKSWYLLAKESVPNFRFSVTFGACNPQDLLVVVPWALSNVLSGEPIVYTPWVENAQYAAKFRNHWWKHIRTAKGSATSISEPQEAKPYPKKSDKIEDKPTADSGGNFGRMARTKIMDSYIEESLQTLLCGVPATSWISFFRTASKSTT